MKFLLKTVFIFALVHQSLTAQTLRGLDSSPGDIAYFPDNFAHDRKDGEKAIFKITYHRPLKKERKIFGSLVPYNEVWRTGANEAPEIKLYQDVSFAGKQLKAGTYSLLTIPGENEWTIIFNKDLDYWGAYNYKSANDLLRVQATVKKSEKTMEAFSIQTADKGANAGVLYLGWDDTIVELPFSY